MRWEKILKGRVLIKMVGDDEYIEEQAKDEPIENEQELRINMSFGVVGCKDISEAQEQLGEAFGRENRTAENEFWGNMELVEVIE